MSDINVVNPGLVNVADESDGPLSIDQAKTVTVPCTNAGPIVQAADENPICGAASESPSDVTPPMTAQETVEGGTASPTSPNTINTTENTVIDQPESVQQYAKTTNVFV